MQDKLLTTKDAAPLLGVSIAFLERDRWAGARVPFIRIGSRAVRYRISDLNPESAISDIHQRIGGEIHPKQVKRALEELIGRGAVRFEGNYRWRRYWAVS